MSASAARGGTAKNRLSTLVYRYSTVSSRDVPAPPGVFLPVLTRFTDPHSTFWCARIPRIGGGQGMIGEPKFWYGGMLQQAAAGRFLGYGGMRQPGVGDFTYTFTHHARARRGLETSIAIDVWSIVLLSSRQKVARHDKRFRMQLPVNLSWVGGPHIKTRHW